MNNNTQNNLITIIINRLYGIKPSLNYLVIKIFKNGTINL